MFKEPKPMQEIHVIQERIYEEDKKLTSKERVEKTHREVQKAIVKYGLKLKMTSLQHV